MIDNTDEYKWDGLDHLMNSNPNTNTSHKPIPGAPKASIFDLNNVRDSVLFDKDKERFSFCLSPPKDPQGYKSKPQQHQPISQHPISSFNMNSKENISKNTLNQQRIITTSNKQQTVQQQQPSKPIQITQKPLPNIQPVSGVSLSKISASPSKTTLSQQPPSPKIKPIAVSKKDIQSVTDVPLDGVYLTNNTTYNSQNNIVRPGGLSSRPGTPTGINNQPSTSANQIRPLSSRPGTPTQLSSTQTTAAPSTLNRRPATPTKQLVETLSVVPIGVPKINNNSLSNNVVSNSSAALKDVDSISVVSDAKIDSRIKILEMDNRVLRQQMVEKDKTMEQLNTRINELEEQMRIFMNDVKIVLMNSLQQQQS